MYFEYYLDDLEIDEPEGLADIVLNMKRDNNWHGVFFEASTSDLGFYGPAALYLKEKKETDGLRADVTLKILQACGVYDELETIFEGKLDFRKYSASCGTSCIVTMPVEQTGCIMTLRNRFDQKVDMDSGIAFNKTTAIPKYSKMNFDMEIPAQELLTGTRGRVSDDTDIFNFPHPGVSGVDHTIVRPTYQVILDESLQTSNLIPIFNYASTITTEAGIDMTPQLLLEETPDCFDGSFPYEFRMKGTVHVFKPGGTLYELLSTVLKVVKWDGVGSIFVDATLVASFDTGIQSVGFVNSVSGSFDHTFTGTATINNGEGFYCFIDIETNNGGVPGAMTFDVVFEKETEVDISASKSCPPTRANVYMTNESLSHVVEAITDGCLKVKSDYYGRTDSEPYASAEDGCGSLRILTSGLKIRRAEPASFFASMKDLFDGLKGIDNIGMGIEDNSAMVGTEVLRIEPVEHFYQDEEVLFLRAAPNAIANVQEQLYWSVIKTGYKKWEVENINGLDEYNSNREYRTSLTSVSNTLDITSAFIAGGYPWEVTRQQSFAATGQADTKYDNDTFIACVERDAYGFHIEQGNIDNPENIFSPGTAYNWRIRPLSNLMRWFKSIANSYPNLVDTINKLFFSSGTGNFTAKGEIGGAYPECKLENGPKAENKDLSITDFVNQTEAVPLWKPEYMPFKYPLSVKDYKLLKSKPYGYITVECGEGNFVKGFVQEVKYSLMKGECDFILKLKWV